MGKITIIYHKNCTDGFSSAVILNKKLSNHFKNISFLPLSHDDELPLNLVDTVYMLDFSYPREKLIELSNHVKSITIYDHHKTVIEYLQGIENELSCYYNLVLDTNRAACEITWEECFPTLSLPLSVQDIADRDLSLFSRKNTRNTTAYFYSLPQDILLWEKMLMNDFYFDVVSLGEAIEEENKKIIPELLENSSVVSIGNYSVAIVLANREYASDIGEQLLLKHLDVDFSMSYRRVESKYHFSLRSRPVEFDVASFSESFNGGGHFVSAGFISEKLPWEIDYKSVEINSTLTHPDQALTSTSHLQSLK